MIIDSHCHLDYLNSSEELQGAITRASKNDVNLLLTICTTNESFNKIKLIINKYKNVYGTYGIHPHETKNYPDINCDNIIKFKNEDKKVIGIGETGLDYYYNHSDKNLQKKIFIEHIKASKKLNIPLVVHSRNAEDDTFDILKSFKKDSTLKVIIHCFTGSKSFAEKLINIGCYISVSGIITFKKSKELADTISCIPIDRLLVETDSPYLSPEPHRGKKNEPSFITHTVNKLSVIKKISKESVVKNTTLNFKKLFDLS